MVVQKVSFCLNVTEPFAGQLTTVAQLKMIHHCEIEGA